MNLEIIQTNKGQQVEITFDRVEATPISLNEDQTASIERVLMDNLNGNYYFYFKNTEDVILLTPDGYKADIKNHTKGMASVKVFKENKVVNETAYYNGLPDEFSLNLGRNILDDRVYNPDISFEHHVIVE